MRICLDLRPALRRATGVGTYVSNLLRALASAHPEDSYTAFSASWRHRLDGSLPPAGVSVVDRRLPVRLLDWSWHRCGWPPIERLAGDQDIAHSPSPMLLPTRRARRVVTVHDCWFLRHPEDTFGPVRRDYVPLARRAARRADAVLVPSASTAADVAELLDVEPARTFVTPLGVDPAFRPSATADATIIEGLRRAHGLGERYLLFVGRREPRKNLGNLLAAIDRLAATHADLCLAIVGPEAPGWETTWAAATPAARRRTRLLPHQPPAVLAHLYAASAATVIPSRWEGFGLIGLEAMAAGAPVVATRVGALPEVLADAAAWCAAGDPEALANAVAEVLDDAARAAELRRRGRSRAAEFHWQRTADLTHAVYRRLLGR